MSYSVNKNSSTTGLSLVEGVTTTLTLKPETNLKFIIEDSCLGDIVTQNFFDNSQQTLTLIHGSGSFTNNFKGLNCGTIQATVTLSVVNGQIYCNVDATKTFNKSFINARIEGNIVFDVTQTPCYISVTPSNAPIKIERDGQAFGNNTAFSPNDEIVISLDQEDLSADTRVLSIKVNNDNYTSFPITHPDLKIVVNSNIWGDIKNSIAFDIPFEYTMIKESEFVKDSVKIKEFLFKKGINRYQSGIRNICMALEWLKNNPNKMVFTTIGD